MKNKSIIEKLGITPGPWEIDKRTHPCDGEYTSIGPLVPDDEIQAYNPYIECTGADAAIVAAAPEMLEALIDIIMVDDDLKFLEAMKKAALVIEKASGRKISEITEIYNALA